MSKLVLCRLIWSTVCVLPPADVLELRIGAVVSPLASNPTLPIGESKLLRRGDVLEHVEPRRHLAVVRP